MRAAASAPMASVRAVRLTAEASRRLLGAPGLGRVHSVFARAVNVELAGLGHGGWVSLHGDGPIPAPFGVACARLDALPDLAGAPARLEAGALVLGDRLRVALDQAVSVETTLPPTAPAPPVAPCLARARAGGLGGLLPAVASLLGDEACPEDALARLAGPALRVLGAATTAGDAVAAADATQRLLGLGPGLTPAGDDAVVGWLAAAWTGGGRGRALVAGVGPGLLAAAAARTTALSRAVLAAAVAGQAAEPVHRFVVRPDGAGLDGLLALGATSGRDCLAGYLLGRAALAACGGRRLPAPAGAAGQ